MAQGGHQSKNSMKKKSKSASAEERGRSPFLAGHFEFLVRARCRAARVTYLMPFRVFHVQLLIPFPSVWRQWRYFHVAGQLLITTFHICFVRSSLSHSHQMRHSLSAMIRSGFFRGVQPAARMWPNRKSQIYLKHDEILL